VQKTSAAMRNKNLFFTNNIMDEMIEITAEKVKNSLEGYSNMDQSIMLLEISKKLIEFSHECLAIEYGLTE
jgi:hypothetical protein